MSKVSFGHYTFDLQSHRLESPAGEIALNPKALALLSVLLQNAGNVLSKDQLMAEVWAGTFVSDDALVQRILDIRKALGDDSKQPCYVRTYPKRGYEFIARVQFHGERDDRVVEKRIRSRSWWVAGVAFLLILIAGPPVIGILRSTIDYHSASRQAPGGLEIVKLSFLPGQEDYPVFNPAQHHILYASDERPADDPSPSSGWHVPAAGATKLWMMELATRKRTQVTSGPWRDSEPDWAPDGEWIAFRSERSEGGLYVCRVDHCREPEQVAPFGHHPRWSPDSRSLVFHTEGGTGQIFVWNREERQSRPVIVDTPRLGNIAFPAWDRDGRHIYFVAIVSSVSRSEGSEDRAAVGHQIWRVPVRGGHARLVTRGVGIVRDGGFDLDFTGGAIIFVGLDHSLWRLPVDWRSGEPQGLPEQLTLSTEGHQHPRVTSHGQVLFSTVPAPETLWLLPFQSDGSLELKAMKRLTHVSASGRGPSVSPDRRHMAYFRWQGERFEIWSLDLSTERHWVISPPDRLSRIQPFWSKDGKSIYYRVLRNPPEWRVARFDEGHGRLVGERRLKRAALSPTPWEQGLASSSGRFRVSLAQDGHEQRILIERVAKSEPVVWRSDPGIYVNPSWSPDERRIYFLASVNGWFNVWALNVDRATATPDGPPVQLTFFRGAPYLLSDSELGYTVLDRGLVLSLREAQGDICVLRPRPDRTS